MRNFFLLFFGLTSSPAFAEWVEIYADDLGAYSVNIPATETPNHKIKMWGMSDYKSAQKAGSDDYRSIKSLFEYDCNEAQRRMLSITFYQESRGRGLVVQTDAWVAEWEPIIPDSLGGLYLKTACEQKHY